MAMERGDGRLSGDAKTPRGGRILGSLKDALRAASRDEPHASTPAAPEAVSVVALARANQVDIPRPPHLAEAAPASPPMMPLDEGFDAGVEAVELFPEPMRVVRTTATVMQAMREDRQVAFVDPPTTRVLRPGTPLEAAPRTRLVRGKQKIERAEFAQDPVVGFLIVVGGPGLGAARAIYEGNNTVGRAASNRIVFDFGDETISAGEQAYIRYDSTDRSFLFVPNLAKTNVVSVNDKRPTSAVALKPMDLITLGRTQVAFLPFCGSDFDWSEIAPAPKDE